MQGNEQVISVLNQVLRKELTGINQYFIHAKMCESWGYAKLAKKIMEESIDEMKHADAVIERILFLEGTPNLSVYDKIDVGKTVREQLDNDLSLEIGALKVLNDGIKICDDASDVTSHQFLEGIMKDEEDHVDWIEAQFHKIKEVGYELWLSQQIYE